MKKHFLALFVLATVATSVFGQTNSLDTSNGRIAALLKEMHDEATWGLPTTNGIQLGVAIFNGDGVKQFHGVRQFRVFTYLYDETNFWMGLYPPSSYRLSLSLKDADGKEVEKTKEGKAITKPVGLIVKAEMKMRAGRIQGGADFLIQKNPERYESPFNLLDCFVVEKPGTNTLTVGATIYKKSSDTGIYEIALPPVSILVPITQAEIDNYRTSKKLPSSN